MKKISLIISMLVVFCLSIGLVSASGTFDLPPDGGTIRSSYTFVITSTDIMNVSNCSVSGSSAKTSDTLSFYVYNFSGKGSYNSSATAAYSTWADIDSNDWILSATCYNITNGATNTSAVTSITVTLDNHKPSVSSPSPATGTYYNDQLQKYSIAFSVTCSNATSATLYIDGNAHTMTESSDTCSYTKDFLNDMIHNWYVDASDGTNTTTGSTYTLEINTPGGGATKKVQQQQQQQQALATQSQSIFKNADGSISMAGVAIIALGGYLLYTQGKKKKKK